MARLTKDTVGDMDTPDVRIARQVAETGKDTLGQISHHSNYVRHALRKNFDIIYPSSISGVSRDLKYEARNQVLDIPKHLRTGFEKTEAYNRAERFAIPEDKLAETRSTIEVLPRGPVVIKDVSGKRGGVDDKTDIQIHHDRLFAGGIHTEDEVFNALQSWRLRRPLGKRIVTYKSGMKFTDEQAREVAKKYVAIARNYQNLGKLYSADGTSELNIQTALKIAQKYPEKVLAAVTVSKESAAKETALSRAKLQIQQAVTELAALAKIDSAKSYDELGVEGTNIAHDIRHVAGFDTTRESSKADELFNTHALSVADGDAAEIKKKLREELPKIVAMRQKYVDVANLVERIYTNAKAAGILPQELKDYIDEDPTTHNPVFRRARLVAGLDPKSIAESFSRSLALPSKEDLEQEIKDKKKAEDEIEAGTLTPPSRKAILDTYQIEFEERGHPPEIARLEALKLYGVNSVGHSEWKVAKDTMRLQGTMGREGRFYQWPQQQLKELAYGSQESYICHIAESPAIGLQHDLTNRFYGPIPFAPNFLKIFDNTRYLGILCRKHNARPAWGAMNQDQLLTAYYAIRNGISVGDINNTFYIRKTADEIARLLIANFAVETAELFEIGDMPEEDRKKADAAHQQQWLGQQIRLMLGGEIPEQYASSANEAVAFARQETGKMRKWAGRTLLNATGWGEKTYTSLPARAAATTFVKTPYRAGKWTLGAMGTGIKKLWEKGNEKVKVI